MNVLRQSLKRVTGFILVTAVCIVTLCSCAGSGSSSSAADTTASEPDGAGVNESSASGAGVAGVSGSSASETYAMTESDTRTSAAGTPETVVALSKSNADLWLLAGGTLAAASDDAMELDGISDDTVSLGDMDHVSLEAVAALNPDLLILFSTDPAQKALGEAAQGVGINVYYTDINDFEDYDTVMAYFTSLTGRADLYKSNVSDVRNEIDKIKDQVPQNTEKKTYLLLHVSATKSKAEKNDYFASEIFNDLGLENIASDDSSFDELSLEAIVNADPDYIFVVPRGDDDKAKASFDELFTSQPAWESLSAVKENKVYLLEKDLFGLKPNNRWAESYQKAYDILYGND